MLRPCLGLRGHELLSYHSLMIRLERCGWLRRNWRSSAARRRWEPLVADPQTSGGLVFACSPDEFGRALRRENHTLKRALTDPRLFSGMILAWAQRV